MERGWFVAALSADITNQPLSVPVFGEPLVLVRNAAAVWALEDRCPHRGVPLSAGCLTKTGLACPYHGWTFDGDGICREMPGWPDASPTDVRIAAFDVIERDGLVWLAAKSKALLSRALPDRIENLGHLRHRLLSQSVSRLPIIDAQERVLEAPFRQGTVTVTGDGFMIDDGDGTFVRRKRFIERAWLSGLGVVQLERRYRSGSTLCVTLCFTPCDDRSTHVFAMAHVEGRWVPNWLLRCNVSWLMRRVSNAGRGATQPVGFVRPYLEDAWQDARLRTI